MWPVFAGVSDHLQKTSKVLAFEQCFRGLLQVQCSYCVRRGLCECHRQQQQDWEEAQEEEEEDEEEEEEDEEEEEEEEE